MFSRTLTLPSPLCVMHKFPSHPSWLQSVFSVVKGAGQTLLWEVFPAGQVGYLGRSGMSPKPDFCLAWERRDSYSLAGFSLELLAASAWINLDFMVGTSRLTQVTDVAVQLYFKTKKPRVLLQLDAVRLIVFILHAAGKPGGALSPLLAFSSGFIPPTRACFPRGFGGACPSGLGICCPRLCSHRRVYSGSCPVYHISWLEFVCVRQLGSFWK